MNTDIQNDQNLTLKTCLEASFPFDTQNDILRYFNLPQLQKMQIVSKHWKTASENTLKTIERDWKKAGDHKEVWQVIGKLLRLPSFKHERNLVRQFIEQTKKDAEKLINPTSAFSASLKSEMNRLISSDKVEDIHILRKFQKAAAALNFWVPILESHGCDLSNRVSALDLDHDGNKIHSLLLELSRMPNAKQYLFGYNESSKKPFIIISFQDVEHNRISGLDASTKSFMRVYNVSSKIEPLITKYRFENAKDGLKLVSITIPNLDHETAIEHIITAIKGKFEAQKGV